MILFQDFVLCTLMSQSAENSMFLIKGSSLNISWKKTKTVFTGKWTIQFCLVWNNKKQTTQMNTVNLYFLAKKTHKLITHWGYLDNRAYKKSPHPPKKDNSKSIRVYASCPPWYINVVASFLESEWIWNVCKQ